MGCGSSSANDPAQSKGDPKTDKKAANSENAQYQAKMAFLAEVPLMKRLPADQLPIVASVMTVQVFEKGKAVITQGDPGNEFFVIQSGEAIVQKKTDGDAQPKTVGRLKNGDYFGENALLRDEPRQASVIADSKLSTFKITRADFQKQQLNDQLQFGNRRAFGGGGGGVGGMQGKSKPPSPKTDADRARIAKALQANENLQLMVTLNPDRIQKITEVMWKEEVAAGTQLITEGDLSADYYYIVHEGSFDVMQGENTTGSLDLHTSKVVSTVTNDGGSFGELALLYLAPRAATVKANQYSVVWAIDRSQFKAILMSVSDSKITEYTQILSRVEILDSLLAEERKTLAKALVEMHFNQGETILQQGEPGSTFFILYEGEVDIIVDGEEKNVLKASPAKSKAEFFGERALLQNDVRAATVKVTSVTAKTLALDRDSFTALLGPLQELMEGKRTEARKVGPEGRSNLNNQREIIPRKHLERIGLLGCGGFGTVDMMEHKETKETYAMKGLSKGYIVKTGMQESVMNEKNILLMTNSDFIIKLYETYNGSQSLYFLLELALGGELYATYNRKSFHGSEKHAKYYAAGVTFAFEHLHERHIIYRDLKPENLLLTSIGHIKLTDMGLAKFVVGKTYTTCGTPDYFAPELIASTGHTNAVDWWTLGILIFELMSGHPPFESAYPMQIYTKVMKGIQKVQVPSKCQGPVGDLIQALLKNEPSERIPMRPGGVKNLKTHKWFDKFEWDHMFNLQLRPPYVPIVKSKKDLANFCARKEDMPRQIEYHDPGTGWEKNFATA